MPVSVYHLPDGRAVTAREAADAAAEAIRALNHLTGKPAGLTWPSDVHAVLGDLGRLAGLMPQALDQLQAWLDRAAAAGHVVADYGTYDGRTDEALEVTRAELLAAHSALAVLHGALGAAHSATSGLSWCGPDVDED